jgi:hypothetical protein
MALIRMGSIATDISGSIAGVTYARNRSGAYARARVAPINPQSARQSAARNNVSACQAAYAETLIAAQRALWKTLAEMSSFTNKLGASIKLTAQNLFIRINALRLQCGLDILEDAPTPPAGASAPTLTIAATAAAGLTFEDTGDALGAEDCLLFSASRPLYDGINFCKGPYLYTKGVNGVQATPVVVIPPATLVIGNRIFYKWRFGSADGRVSNELTGVVDVVA